MYNQNSGYGQALLSAAAQACPTFGRILVVFNPSDLKESYVRAQEVFDVDPDGNIHFFTSIDDAYAEAVSNNNDVILLDSHSSHTITAGSLTVAKNRVHFVGLDGGGRKVQQGTKVVNSADDTAAFLLKVTGTRCSFKNIKFIQQSTEATALTVAQFGDEGGHYENCSFTFGVADNLDQTDAYEAVLGSDSNTFINCQFGQDTLLTSAARSVAIIDQVNGFEFKSNIFEKCTFLISSSSATAELLRMAAAGDILFTNHFDECSFIASIDSAGGAALTRAMSTANGTTKGTIYVSYPRVHGCNDIGVNGTNNDNLYVFSHAVSADNLTSAQPTTS